LPSPDFAVVGHYIGGLGVYTEDVNANNNNPYGQGEYIWSKDNSRQGLTWFGTSAMAMRRQDASDVRPYTLLSGWSSFVPGTMRTTMTIEQGGNPVFGEDNLPDPPQWPLPSSCSRPAIRLVFWFYFLSIAVPAFSTLLPDFSISLAALCVFFACFL
jgi:hypothetical protein